MLSMPVLQSATGIPVRDKTSTFQFKRFKLHQQYAAMKIGFDGVLLGAWASIDGGRVLDVGTGTGLIALMLVQRAISTDHTEGDAHVHSSMGLPHWSKAIRVDAIELDAAAAHEATENVARSPWPDSVRVIHGQFPGDLSANEAYGLIVSNPPWFREGAPSPTTSRALARHETHLSLSLLFESVPGMLAGSGRFAVVIPQSQLERAKELASAAGLVPRRLTLVRPLPDRPPHRVLLEFAKSLATAGHDCEEDELTIECRRHEYTPEFRRLLRDFYLKF